MIRERFAAGETEASLGAIKAIPGEKASTPHWLSYSTAGVFKGSRLILLPPLRGQEMVVSGDPGNKRGYPPMEETPEIISKKSRNPPVPSPPATLNWPGIRKTPYHSCPDEDEYLQPPPAENSPNRTAAVFIYARRRGQSPDPLRVVRESPAIPYCSSIQ